MGKFLLSSLPFAFLGFAFGCTQVVTVPVRTVIDLTEEPVKVESDSTIDLVEKP